VDHVDTQLTMEQIAQITIDAFAPLICTPEFLDYDHEFRFSVRDPDTGKHLKSRVYKTSKASNASELRKIVESFRAFLLENGMALDEEWHFPELR
jgi:hypothetical protein